jgi:hypothetical protein
LNSFNSKVVFKIKGSFCRTVGYMAGYRVRNINSEDSKCDLLGYVPCRWVPKFQRDILSSSSRLKTVAICSSKTLLVHTSWYHDTEKPI